MVTHDCLNFDTSSNVYNFNNAISNCGCESIGLSFCSGREEWHTSSSSLSVIWCHRSPALINSLNQNRSPSAVRIQLSYHVVLLVFYKKLLLAFTLPDYIGKKETHNDTNETNKQIWLAESSRDCCCDRISMA